MRQITEKNRQQNFQDNKINMRCTSEKGAVFAERFKEQNVINLEDQFFEKVMQLGLMNQQKHSNNMETLTILQQN